MAKIINGMLVRTCSECGITSDMIDFKTLRDTKSGRFYTQNKCKVCFDEHVSIKRIARYKKNRNHEIEVAKKWNIENKKRYNKTRLVKNKFFNGCYYAV